MPTPSPPASPPAPRSKTAEVVQRIRRLIHDGTLRLGDPLPSTRALAAEWGVARGTVTAAYEQLDGEGYLRTRQGAVTRVAAVVHVGPDAADARGGAGAPASAQGARPTPADAVAARLAIDATPGHPAIAAISAADMRAAWRAALGAPVRAATTPPEGTAELREQVAAQLALSRGFAPGAERVIVCAGTGDALSLVVDALRSRAGRAPRIVVEDPGYIGGRRALTGSGAELVPVAVDEEGLDLGALSRVRGADAVMVTPTHQYPLGSVMPVARRRALLEGAARAGVVVIEDDYDSELRHRGSPVPALAALDAEGVVVHAGGFSKILDPRLRCAYLAIPPGPVGEALRAAREARGPVVAEPVQLALAHLLRTGALRRHVGRARRDYAHKRDRIAARAERLAAAGVRAAALQGGLHVVLTWPPALVVAADVVARLAGRGIRVADLSRYAATPRTAAALNGVVVGYGDITPTQVDAVFDALEELLGVPSGPLPG
ncbi:hypothetical protein AOA12_18670 [Microbacterium sp. No. 7]|nr:hypothetical protein AOA12_18670 [Microbacterium sp. No. 7]